MWRPAFFRFPSSYPTTYSSRAAQRTRALRSPTFLRRGWTSLPTPTRSSSAHPRASATCAPRCVIFSINAVGTGRAAPLINKIGSVFASVGTQHGGHETTITSFHTTLFHLGMIVVGTPYSEPRLMNMEEISGGTPYGATALAGADGHSRPVSDNELAIARFQGR